MEIHRVLAFMLVLMTSIAVFGIVAEAANTQATEFAFATIDSGEIMGFNYKGVYCFRGIPYAKAKRFQMPEEVESWTGIRPCLSWGVICPAPYGLNGYTNFTEFMTPTDHNFIQNEDCQNLNVWTTSLDPEANKPVIVFLHGGGFTNGSSMELRYYDGHNITASGDIVFVSVNHRLNVLGSLDLSAYGEEYRYSANCGMADIVAALRWVRDNIAVFGGDPENVTLVGQSGGAGKVQALMGMPAAVGLFNKVVLQSGASDGPPTLIEDRRAQSEKVLEILGITADNIKDIEAVPYETLLAAAVKAGLSYGPVVDGDYYPAKPWVNGEEIEMSKNIPVMASTSFAEFYDNFAPMVQAVGFDGYYRPDMTEEKVMAALTERYGGKAEAIAEEFRAAYPNKELFDALYIYRGRNNNVASMRASNGGAPVYQVIYAMGYPVFGGVSNIHTGGDLPYLFNNVDKIDILIAGNEEAAYELARIASTYLCNFARTGDPNGDGLPEWPAFDRENGYTMILDEICEARSYHDVELLKLMNSQD